MKKYTKDEYVEMYGQEEGEKRYNEALRRQKKYKLKNINPNKKKNYTYEDVLNGDAIQCKECNEYLPRLQWTHFKYKCFGNISSIKEYRNKYPTEYTVAPNLCKQTAVTKENFINIYGVTEGLQKWNEYRERQAETNTFEYKLQKYGWTKEEFDEYNQNRAVTLENCINKHGYEKGLEIFNNYCEKQKYSVTLDFFTNKYGDDEGSRLFFNFARARSFNNRTTSKKEQEVYEKLKEIFHDSSFTSQIALSNPYFGPFDMGSHDKKKLIEFYGDYWHLNPRLFESNHFHQQKGQYAKQIRAVDQRKRQYASNIGYDVFVIWEFDWEHNYKEIIDEVYKWYNDVK